MTGYKIHKLGKLYQGMGLEGDKNGTFFNPIGIATDSSGNALVADDQNSRTKKFSNTGAFIRKWGCSGTGDGCFSRPMDVAVNSAGNVFVLDSNNNRVQEFSNTGTFIRKWGSCGSGKWAILRWKSYCHRSLR